MPAGALVGGNRETLVEAGTFFASAGDVARIVVGSYQNRPVFVEDVARVVDGPELAKRYVWHGVKDGGEYPAVTIAVAKKPGENAVDVAARVTRRVDELQGHGHPRRRERRADPQLRRDGERQGAEADPEARSSRRSPWSRSRGLALGRREAAIVGVAVLLTLAATLFASWAWGFTLNRVSLFALIFSIGILVDDAIVVVENIHRHRALAPEAPLARARSRSRWTRWAGRRSSRRSRSSRRCCRWRSSPG